MRKKNIENQNNENESITIMNSQSDTEKIILVEECKKTGINEVIKHNQIINNSLKP